MPTAKLWARVSAGSMTSWKLVSSAEKLTVLFTSPAPLSREAKALTWFSMLALTPMPMRSASASHWA